MSPTRPSPEFSRSRAKTILGQAFPIMIGMGSQNLLNLVDTAMIGHLGTTELAAVGIAGMALWVVTSLLQGFSPAVQAITARRLGEGNHHQLYQALVSAGYLILLAGLPLSVVLVQLTPTIFQFLSSDPAVQQAGSSYLSIRLFTVVFIGFNFGFRGYFNGCKQSWLYMTTLLVMHFINIVLNYGLIFGNFGLPRMEVEGAALGTAIATGLGSLFYVLLLVLFKKGTLDLGIGVLSKDLLKNLLKLALPACLQTFTMALGFLLFFRIVAMISTSALAATNVLINLLLVFLLIAMGFGLAVITMVGHSLGEKKPAEAMAWVKTALWLACTGLGLAGLLFCLFPRPILGVFISDPHTITLAVAPLILLGAVQAIDAAGIILSYAHLGGGASRTVMFISIFNQWFLFLPACFVWVYFFNGQLLHVWICLVAYRCIQFLCYLISIRRGAWLKINF